MAYKKRYHYGESIVWATKNNLDDVFNLKRFPSARFKSFRKLFGMKQERPAQQKAKDLMKKMLAMMATDMIEHNDSFTFPLHKFGFIRVGNLDTHKIKPWKSHFDPLHIGQRYGGVAVLSSIMRGVTGNVRLRLKLTQENELRMYELRDQGHVWK